MTKDDIIRIAVQCQLVTTANRDGVYMQALFDFAALVAAKEREACEELWEYLRIKDDQVRRVIEASIAVEREKLAQWMLSMGYVTGHGDAIEDLLAHLGTQIAERLLKEREACAKVCETTDEPLDPSAAGGVFAAAIRERGKA